MLKPRCVVAVLAIFAQHALGAVKQELVPQHSFGLHGRVSEDGHTLPDWVISGESYVPHLLSDRIVLTPPAPAHARGALWNSQPNAETQWSAEVAFRASGQDRGTGNLQIWYTKDGRTAVGTHSVYTVTKFEGLVLTVDQHGDKGGMLRGFLNDGSTNFRNHQMVDSLSFGFCNFAYRNLGRYSKVHMYHDSRGLKVTIDDQPCFTADKVSLPSGYFFGMTAATSDNPDSFEVSSFLVRTTRATTPQIKARDGSAAQEPSNDGDHRLPNAPEQLPDYDAGSIQKQQDQFADLHNRLQALSHQVNNVFQEFDRIAAQVNDKHDEILSRLPKSTQEDVNALSRRLESIERSLQALERRSPSADYSTHFDNLHKAVKDVKGGLSMDLPDALHQVVRGSGTSITSLVLIVVIIQSVLGALYYLYKRRQDAPKKYL